jgi:hypothetical protein
MLPTGDDLWFTSMLSDPSSDGIHPRRMEWHEPKDLPAPEIPYGMDWGIPAPEFPNVTVELPKSPQLTSSPAFIRPNLNQILSILRPARETRPSSYVKKRTGLVEPRPRFTADQTRNLVTWLCDHADHPYPDNNELDVLKVQTGLNHKQIRVWLVNNRSRLLRGGHKARSSDKNYGESAE